MKKLLLLISLLFLFIVSFAQVKVRGYYRSNGTYVQPHMRSSPDHNPYNNYSYPGNTNPYTGKVATGNPDTYLNNYYNRTSTSSNTSSSNSFNNSSYSPPVNVTPPTSETYNPNVDLFGNPKPKDNLNSSNTTNSTLYKSNNYSAPEIGSKKYLKNSKGSYTGEYLLLTDNNDEVTKYMLYGANDFPKGKLLVFANGEKILCDLFGNVIKHTYPRKK